MKTIVFILIFLFSCNVLYADSIIRGAGVNGLTVIGGSQKRKIYTMGDSITFGLRSTTGLGYRKVLQDLLGIGEYNFVGAFSSSGYLNYDVNHSGVSGNTTAQMLSRMPAELTASLTPPNTSGTKVLIHGGTNFSLNQAGVDDIEDMIDLVVAKDSTIKIYVALIIPSNGSAGAPDADITAYNALLTTMLIAKRAANSNVNRVDMNAAFKSDYFSLCAGDWANNCLFDDLHPNDTGYSVMANMWNRCINNESAVGCNGN